MSSVRLVLMILACLCLLAAAGAEWVKASRINLTGAGLFLWALATLLKG